MTKYTIFKLSVGFGLCAISFNILVSFAAESTDGEDFKFVFGQGFRGTDSKVSTPEGKVVQISESNDVMYVEIPYDPHFQQLEQQWTRSEIKDENGDITLFSVKANHFSSVTDVKVEENKEENEAISVQNHDLKQSEANTLLKTEKKDIELKQMYMSFSKYRSEPEIPVYSDNRENRPRKWIIETKDGKVISLE